MYTPIIYHIWRVIRSQSLLFLSLFWEARQLCCWPSSISRVWKFITSQLYMLQLCNLHQMEAQWWRNFCALCCGTYYEVHHSVFIKKCKTNETYLLPHFCWIDTNLATRRPQKLNFWQYFEFCPYVNYADYGKISSLYISFSLFEKTSLCKK